MRAQDLMSEPLVWANVHDSIQDTTRLMKEKGISGLPVHDRLGKTVGVLTKADLAYYDQKCFERLLEEPEGRALANTVSTQAPHGGFDLRAHHESIEGWISPRIYTVDKNDPLETVITQMLKHRVHRVFVQSKGSGELIGIITLTDVLKHLAVTLRHRRKQKEIKGGKS